MLRGRVYGSEGGVYRVQLEGGEVVEASLRGRLKREARTGDRVVIGDLVEVRVADDGSVTIEMVHPRESQVVRRGPGGRRAKVVAANVDRLVAVLAAVDPLPRQALVDRLLVVGEINHLETVLVLNKTDLLAQGQEDVADSSSVFPRELAALYRGIGYTVVETSAKTGAGLEELKEVLSRGTSALVGPSGVGKSTLLNALEPGLGLRVGELSHRRGTGRHTTVSARLIPLSFGGLVADTPGFSDVGIWGAEPRELESCFPDFDGHRDGCQFRGCSHLHEPGCAVRDAVERGEIAAARFESYRILIEEAESARGVT